MPAAPPISPTARKTAHTALMLIVAGGKSLDEALDDASFATLDTRDRAFARLLLMTVLRHRGAITALLAQCLAKPLPEKAQASVLVLWLGVAQLVFLAIPAHAAVHATVDLAATIDKGGFKGLVNAVLKRIAREGQAMLAALDTPPLALPAWLWQRLLAYYGKAEARAIVLAQQQEPPLDITVKQDVEQWAQTLSGTVLHAHTVRLEAGGRVEALPGFDAGAWWVQDIAASLPATLFGPLSGKRVWDLCAAPGGKTAQLVGAGGDVLAVDSSELRMRRLAANLARLGLQAETLVMDAGRIDTRPGADAILLDAPCSATGTLRRNPDVAWRRSEGDLAELMAFQSTLLDHAVKCLLPGGMLVYCVCSLLPEEGEMQLARFLARHTQMQLLPVIPESLSFLPESAFKTGGLRTLPSHLNEAGGMDGFFAFRARKV